MPVKAVQCTYCVMMLSTHFVKRCATWPTTAVELKDILDKPAAPGRARTGQHRTFTSSEVRLKQGFQFREQVTFGEALAIQATAISPLENLVAVGGVDGAIRLWDLEVRNKLATRHEGLEHMIQTEDNL